jgi:hypothetical protein
MVAEYEIWWIQPTDMGTENDRYSTNSS